ncbi:response regulator transcription factor [Polynucleobacter sp. 30F-ANTBAC]|uniref:response regulator transcription factor n=1 Tax=Polynucleobacter sp. 30F-ANTBAC TaxID=2689095 RepID=UPI001C0DEA35|nr:response regulator transcription factor [Polynucleobacter sp. 30F-ANTBAC]
MRILLVEDDELLASGLASALTRANHLVDHVNDGQKAIDAFKNSDFDMAILDLGLPKVDGTEVLKIIRQKGNHIPVLILSARDSTKDRILGLDLGADDYLTKPFELDELLARIRVLERRQSGSSNNLLEIGQLVLDLAAFTVTWKGELLDLQRREFTLIKKLAENPQQVFNRSQLEESLYGWGDGVESNTIDVHVHNLRKKISAEAIKTIRGVGYRIGKLD